MPEKATTADTSTQTVAAPTAIPEPPTQDDLAEFWAITCLYNENRWARELGGDLPARLRKAGITTVHALERATKAALEAAGVTDPDARQQVTEAAHDWNRANAADAGD